MKLPNGSRAIVDPAKLSDYCLNVTHPRGKHKARMFRAALGITAQNSDVLNRQLLHAAATSEHAVFRERAEIGDLYQIDFTATGPGGACVVRSGWIIRKDEDFPRLTTAFVLD
jgi:hypothetical protein